MFSDPSATVHRGSCRLVFGGIALTALGSAAALGLPPRTNRLRSAAQCFDSFALALERCLPQNDLLDRRTDALGRMRAADLATCGDKAEILF